MGADGLIVWASAVHAEGRGFDSRAGTFRNFFCRSIGCAGVDLCCLSLIVTLWIGKLFFLSYLIYLASLCTLLKKKKKKKSGKCLHPICPPTTLKSTVNLL